MRTRILVLFGIILFSAQARGGEGDYAVSKIPAALLKDANAVKRSERIIFEVKNIGEAILYKKYAITILNANGDNHAAFMEYYDKLHEIKNIEGILYDANGRELKKLRNKQILDLSGSDENLADDNRFKAHHFYHKVYPYTVQYEVEIRYHGTLFFPMWLPREDEHFSVENSEITITCPLSYTTRYKVFNYQADPVVANGKSTRSMTWSVKDLAAIRSEFASPDWYEINTAVFFGPTEFEVEKYKGTMSSWEDFGKFVYELKKGRDQLPQSIKEAVRGMVTGVSDPKEKISRLYEYLQKNTRYISIQLGIGGWQPFDASYVASKAYGDCKALTNYMYSLLKEAGIPSKYTLVKAGRKANKVLADFPSQQFNHVILCVPLASDTVWLECTSQTLAAGYLGDMTADRYALMVDETGGKLVRTPKYGLKENLELRRISASLDEEATLHIKAKTSYAGLQQDYYHGMINALSREKVKERLHEQLDFATYDILNFDYMEKKSGLPAVEEFLEISVSNYATMTGKRLFIVPNIMTRSGRKLPADEMRKHDLLLGMAYQDIDTVEISLPAGYAPESMPKDVTVSSPFGKYYSTVKLEGNKLLYYRDIQHYGGRYPASDYSTLVSFYDAIYRADRGKVVLVKKE